MYSDGFFLSNIYTANMNSIDVFPVLFLFKGSYRVKLDFLHHLLSLISQLRTVTTSERLETEFLWCDERVRDVITSFPCSSITISHMA